MGMLEEGTFCRDPVEGGSFHHRVAIGPGMRPAPIIGDAKEDVGAIVSRSASNRANRCESEEKASGDHATTMEADPFETNTSRRQLIGSYILLGLKGIHHRAPLSEGAIPGSPRSDQTDRSPNASIDAIFR